TLAQMQHTNIVPIYSVHIVGPLQVVCMPYFGSITLARIISDLGQAAHPPPSTGRELLRPLYEPRVITAEPQFEDTWIPASGPRPRTVAPESPANLDRLAGMTHVEVALWLTARIGNGLAHAHERGILHCDLKPANVLLTNDGQ